MPVPYECPDPRFEVRRLDPREFEVVFDLVDETFGVKRPRAAFDWLYRRNPHGPARCVVAIDRGSGAVVCNNAAWPWPIACAAEPLAGVLAGDFVVKPVYQRQGLAKFGSDVYRTHPWHRNSTRIGFSNQKSVAWLRKRQSAQG